MSEKRTCGNCDHWEAGLLDDSPNCRTFGRKGDCECPIPKSACLVERWTYERYDATECPCWKCAKCGNLGTIWKQECSPNEGPATGYPCPVCKPKGESC